MIKFEAGNNEPCCIKIKVIGIGGGGTNAVNTMINAGLKNISFASVNTDVQGLQMAQSSEKIQIGAELTGGLGSGARPEVGKEAAMQSLQMLHDTVDGIDILFLTAGFGGGTGTGAAPIIAQIAKELDILCIGVVTRPFGFEGKKRAMNAIEGLEELKHHVNTMICIPNDKILDMIDEETPFADAFKAVDGIISDTISNMTNIITEPGLINLDFADLKTIMSIKGDSVLSFGEGRGKNKALNAVDATLSSVLVEDRTIQGAKGLLLSIVGGDDMTLFEVNNAVKRFTKMVHPDANIIFGTNIDKNIKDKVYISMVATGIDPIASVVEKMNFDREFTTDITDVQVRRPVDIQFEQDSLFAQKSEEEDLETPTFIRRNRRLFGTPLYSNDE
ncbi:MAG: cell division protein FtsZ [Candidatus Aureabacteria bacterium]|nr:cell division protein FtsZ [Candidatus Auribacterota bacterium]